MVGQLIGLGESTKEEAGIKDNTSFSPEDTFRERKGERKNIDLVPQPGIILTSPVCPDQELNQQPFSAQDIA